MDVIHVLLVDDDPDVLEIMAGQLRAGGLGVDVALSGEDALEKLERFIPELVIADVQMPGMDGYELCRRVRATGHDEIPFFFCSSNASLPQRVIGLKAGADDYLVKPVAADDLLFRVRFQLERNRRMREVRRMSRARTSGVLTGTIGDLEIDQILQLIDQRGKGDFRLRVSCTGGVAAVYLSDRIVLHAEFGSLSGEKAFHRLLSVTQGDFTIEPWLFVGEPTMNATVEELLLGSLAQLDEFRLLRERFVEGGDFIFVRYGDDLFSRRFEQITLDMFALIEEHHLLDRVLDASPYTDLVTIRVISELIQLGLVGVKARALVTRETALT